MFRNPLPLLSIACPNKIGLRRTPHSPASNSPLPASARDSAAPLTSPAPFLPSNQTTTLSTLTSANSFQIFNTTSLPHLRHCRMRQQNIRIALHRDEIMPPETLAFLIRPQ